MSTSAQAGTLVVGYGPGFGFDGGEIAMLNGSDLDPLEGGANVFHKPTGLAWGAGSLFVATQEDGSSYLRRYNTSLQSLEVNSVASYQFGPLAHTGSTLAAGFDGFLDNGILQFENDLDFIPGTYTPLSPPSGLAFGDGDLFVSFGNTLARYDLDGTLINSVSLGGSITFGPLAFGDGMLFAGVENVGPNFELYSIAAIDPANLITTTMQVFVDEAVTGLAFGDGGVFAGFEHAVAKYDTAGVQTAFLDFGGLEVGPLAFIPQDGRPEEPCRLPACGPGGGVPEPTTWVLMILGFGGVGVALRTRRSPLKAAPV